jgi:hypothetical protein
VETTASDTPDVSRAEPIPTPPGTKKWDRDAWIQVYADKGTVKAACKAVGISRDTAYEERKRNPAFAEAWDREEVSVTDQLEKTLVEIALEGEGSHQVRALEFALKARRPAVYRESVNVNHGGKIGVEVEEGVDEAIGGYLTEIERLSERLAVLESGGQAAPAGPAEGAAVGEGS